MIEICYALHDKTTHYTKFVGTSIYSVLANTKEQVRFHILHDNTLTDLNRKRLQKAANDGSGTIVFYNVQELALPAMQSMCGLLYDIWLDYYSPAVLYRLLMWDILPLAVEKIIYLDADVIALMDIARLWQEDTGEEGLAAVQDALLAEEQDKSILFAQGNFQPEHYFNAGVLLMRRQHKYGGQDYLGKLRAFFTMNPDTQFPDQDALNMLFPGARLLDARYNRLLGYERKYGHIVGEGLYHFSGEAFSLSRMDAFLAKWWEYFSHTPWCDCEVMRRLGEIISQVQEMKILDAQAIMAAVSGKQRVAVCESRYTESVRKLLKVKAGEEIIPCQNVIGNLPDFTKAKQQLGEDYVFIFFVDKFNPLHKALKAAGWQTDEYVDGRLMLKVSDGGYSLDEHRMVLEL